MTNRRYAISTMEGAVPHSPVALEATPNGWLSRWCEWVLGRPGVMIGPRDPRLPLTLDARYPWHRDFLTWCLARNENVRSRDWMERQHEKSGRLFWSLGSEIAFHDIEGVFFTTMDNKRVVALGQIDSRDPLRSEHALALAVKASLSRFG